MFRLFNSNTLLSYALLPFILVAMHLRPLLHADQHAYAGHHTPLWHTLLSWLPDTGLMSVVSAIVVLFFITLIVNTLTSNHRFTEHASTLGGMFFAILCGGFTFGRALMPVHIFVLFLSLSLINIFEANKEQAPMRRCFAASVWFMIGSLLWAKGIWFLPFFWLAMLMQRSVSGRCLMAATLGGVFPLALCSAFYFCFGDIRAVGTDYLDQMFNTSPLPHLRLWAMVYMIAAVVGIGIALLGVLRIMPTLKINESLNCRTLIWLMLIASALYFTPWFSMSMQLIGTMAGAIFLATSSQRLLSPLQAEISTWIWLVGCFWAQWL